MKKLLMVGIILLLVGVSIPSTGRIVEKSCQVINAGFINKQNYCNKIEYPYLNITQIEGKLIACNESSTKIHPTFARTKTGIHMAAFRDEKLGQIIWTHSNDNGRTYHKGEYLNIGGDYPTVDYWGNKIFCGTFVTDNDDPMGDVIYFFWCEDPKDSKSYAFFVIDSNLPYAPPIGDMRDAAIACDNTIPNSWYWGAASYTINVSSYNNVPLLLYPEIPFSYLFRMSYYVVENCYHTDIDIDNTTQMIYAIYDCYDTDDETWKLYARVKDFLDLQSGYDEMFELNGAEGLYNPVVAADNDSIIIVAETEEYGNADIVCLYSTDGLDNIQKVFLTLSVDDEHFPEIEHVSGNTFICTYIKNGGLYKKVTENGGASWSEPLLVDSDVVEEYKAATISDCASQVLYEKRFGENIDLSISPLRNYTISPDIQIPSITGRDEIHVTIYNNGGGDEYNVSWWLNITGAEDLSMNGVIPSLNASKTYTITIDDFNGKGSITLQATVESPNRQIVTREIIADLKKTYVENIVFLWDDNKTLYVDDNAFMGGIGTKDHPIKTIISASYASSHGDTIRVAEGTYYTGVRLWITKSVRLIGEDKQTTIIKQGFTYHTGCGSVHSKFTHQGSDLVIQGNNILTSDNIIIGEGIDISGFSNRIINNYIRSCRKGMDIRSSQGNHLIENNVIEDCTEYGILYWGGSSDNSVIGNTIRNNKGYAIKLEGVVYRNKFAHNLIENNSGGFIFNELHDSIIKNNNIKNNYKDGIRLDSSNNNIISFNVIEQNNRGIYLQDSSLNLISHNTFRDNGCNATFHHNRLLYLNFWLRNYWGPRIPLLPKIIHGKITFHFSIPPESYTIKWVNFDCFPRVLPFNLLLKR